MIIIIIINVVKINKFKKRNRSLFYNKNEIRKQISLQTALRRRKKSFPDEIKKKTLQLFKKLTFSDV